MLKKMRKISLIMIVVGNLVATNITTFASEPVYNDKKVFAENILATKEVNKNIDSKTQNDINEVLMKYVSNDIDGALDIINAETTSFKAAIEQNAKSNYEVIEDYLNSNNVYIYSYETETVGGRSVGATDVKMNSVIISYNASNDTWSVTGGGYWLTTAYEDDAPNPSVYVGAKDVGGLDAVGFGLINTSGATPTLVSSSGYVHDGYGTSITLNNPANGNSAQGLIFEYQDQIYYSDDLENVCYMGYGFAAQGIYTSDFEDYNGRARSYYAHTWDECSINSMGLSNSGLEITFSNNACGWAIYNDSDTVF